MSKDTKMSRMVKKRDFLISRTEHLQSAIEMMRVEAHIESRLRKHPSTADLVEDLLAGVGCHRFMPVDEHRYQELAHRVKRWRTLQTGNNMNPLTWIRNACAPAVIVLPSGEAEPLPREIREELYRHLTKTRTPNDEGVGEPNEYKKLE